MRKLGREPFGYRAKERVMIELIAGKFDPLEFCHTFATFLYNYRTDLECVH